MFFQSLGCAKNLVDAEVMLGLTTEDNFQIVQDPSRAGVIVVNTCSFIGDSKRESVNAILELAQYKDKSQGVCDRLIVTGCLPQRYKEDLKASFPEVDAFVGTGQYGQILDFIKGEREREDGFKHPRYIHHENTPRINSQPSHRAYLKISEGCIKNCAFCIIPKIRGTLRSRTIPSLIAEASHLISQGVLELNLIAQDLTDYGRDLRDGSNLTQLLKELVKIDGLRWIRLLYVYPDELDDDLLEVIATEEKICKYIDTPIQHISDNQLRLMNRKVTGELIRARLRRIRERIPGVAIRSTVIVGYPGETAEEFEQLKAFVKEAQFDHLGVFHYSHEEGTASYLLPKQLEESVKLARKEELLTLQQLISRERLKNRVGSEVSVLVEGVSSESEFLISGRHAGQAPDVDGNVLIRGGSPVLGTIQRVRVEETMEYDLIGTVV
ncbi:MAG: 30S ribosomal protein S12 methylthiotransferase RimO [Deltaproteobacteria bacterium]|nr:30S ribosomal protein S12 methylthiotransferase RimO [Deltaproteobacteria bacterium]